MRPREGGLAKILRLADRVVSGGHDVRLVGLALTWEQRWSIAPARAHPLHVIRLTTPLVVVSEGVIHPGADQGGWLVQPHHPLAPEPG